MTGAMVKLPPDEDTPEKRVNKIFDTMDFNHDKQLTYEEFAEGSKKDPSIVQVRKTLVRLAFPFNYADDDKYYTCCVCLCYAITCFIYIQALSLYDGLV